MTGRKPEASKISAFHGLQLIRFRLSRDFCGHEGISRVYDVGRLVAVELRHKCRHNSSAQHPLKTDVSSMGYRFPAARPSRRGLPQPRVIPIPGSVIPEVRHIRFLERRLKY